MDLSRLLEPFWFMMLMLCPFLSISSFRCLLTYCGPSCPSRRQAPDIQYCDDWLTQVPNHHLYEAHRHLTLVMSRQRRLLINLAISSLTQLQC